MSRYESYKFKGHIRHTPETLEDLPMNIVRRSESLELVMMAHGLITYVSRGDMTQEQWDLARQLLEEREQKPDMTSDDVNRIMEMARLLV